MALSIALAGSPTGGNVIGAQRLVTADVTVGAYATNGVAFTPAQFGLNRIDYLRLDPAGGIIFETDYTNKKVKAYRQKDPADAGGADIALPEVANAVSLSSASRALVIGV
jgi:hypothetical protein